jgi:hypothetical protein
MPLLLHLGRLDRPGDLAERLHGWSIPLVGRDFVKRRRGEGGPFVEVERQVKLFGRFRLW